MPACVHEKGCGVEETAVVVLGLGVVTTADAGQVPTMHPCVALLQ